MKRSIAVAGITPLFLGDRVLLESRQSIEARVIRLDPALHERLLASFGVVLDQNVAVTHKVVVRHGPSAGPLNPFNRDFNDAAHRNIDVGKIGTQRIKSWSAELMRRSLSVDPKNQRIALESAEHQTDSAIFPQMSVGFDSASSEIDIGDPDRIEPRKTRQPLRRNVDMTVGGKWRRRNEEHLLLVDEGGFLGANLVKNFHLSLGLIKGDGTRQRESQQQVCQ